MGAENLDLTGFRFPDRPARNESLYLLSYPSPYPVSYSVSKGLFAWRDVNWSSGTEVMNERNSTSAPSYMPLRSI